MKRLCRRLELPLWQGVGLMESIWLLTAREAPRGDIGRLSDEDISLGIDYHGDEHKLIEAMIACGWLETHENMRVVVHDWFDHAPDAVHMRLARSRAYFWCGRAPKIARLGGSERTNAHDYYTLCALNGDPCAQKIDPCASVRTSSASVRTSSAPVRTSSAPPSPPPPKPIKETTPSELERKDSPLKILLRETAERIFARHPVGRKNTSLADTEKRLAKIIKPVVGIDAKTAKLKKIDNAHLIACESEKWTKQDGEFANGLRNWFVGEMYDLAVHGGFGTPLKENWPGESRGVPNPGLVGGDW